MRGKRKSSVPDMFLVKPLAQMIFLFIPPLQVRQWICEARGTEQTQLCEWISRENIDTKIISVILATDNLDAFRILRLSTSYGWQGQLATYSCPTILNWVITQSRIVETRAMFFTMCTQENITSRVPLANFKVLGQAIEFDAPSCKRLFQIIVKEQGDDKYPFVDYIVNQLHWEVVFDFRNDFDQKMWNIIHHKVSTTNSVSLRWLATMPLDVFKTLDPISDRSKRLDIWNRSVDACNWPLANYLWQPDYKPQFHSHFYWFDVANETDTKVNMQCPDDVFFDKPRYTKRHKKKCVLNSALKYLQSGSVFSPGSMAFAIMEYFKTMMETRSFASLVWMFECACLTGCYHIMRALWEECSFCQQQMFTCKLRQVRFATNRKAFEFAFRVIGHSIEGEEQLRWIRAAYNSTNCKLWHFLASTNKLSVQLFLTKQVYFILKPVAMLETIWDQLIDSKKYLSDLILSAVRNQNREIATFLNDKQIQVKHNLLCEFVRPLCDFRLWHFLSQTKITSENVLYEAFASANMETCKGIWRVKPFQTPTKLLVDFKKSLSLDACMFLLRVGAVSLQAMLAIIQKDNPLADNIRAMTYCVLDETRKQKNTQAGNKDC